MQGYKDIERVFKDMDEINTTNRQRWNALADANVEWSQPRLEHTLEEARRQIGRHGILTDVAGKRVLCLASGGGQDSVSFGLLGADVTVLDLSDVQLARDQQAAAHHGLQISTCQGDMRDLSSFPDAAFDIVWQVYSLNFVPAVEPVFRGVGRVLKPGGIYFVQFANPFVQAVDNEAWDGHAYPLINPYLDGEDITRYFPGWDVPQPDGTKLTLPSPHEFRHTLGTVLNTLLGCGFTFLGLWEWMLPDPTPQPGSWPHFIQVAPPWFDSFWRRDGTINPGDKRLMEHPTTKEQVIDRIHAERKNLDEKIDGLSPVEMTTPGALGHWSVKDLLAHLVDWERRFAGWYEAGLRCELPHLPEEGFDWEQLPALNQQGYERHKDRPLQDVLANYLASHQQILALVDCMTEEEIFEVGRYAWTGETSSMAPYLAANTYSHYRWAAEEIRLDRIRQPHARGQ